MLKPLNPLKPLKLLNPLKPIKPLKPLKPLRPLRPPPLHGKCHLKFPFWLFAHFPKNGRQPAEIVVLPCSLLRPERTRWALKDLSSERVFTNQSKTRPSKIVIFNLANAVLLDVLSEEEITIVKPAMRSCQSDQNCRGNAVQEMLTRCFVVLSDLMYTS